MKLNVETQYCFIIKLIALLSFLCLQNEREAFFFLSLSPPILCVIHKEKNITNVFMSSNYPCI